MSKREYDERVKDLKEAGLTDKQIAELEASQDDVRMNRCSVCKVPYVPAFDSVAFSGPWKGKWDRHTWRANCECLPPNIRISIG